MTAIRVALVGFGTSGERFHWPLLRQCPQLAVVAAVTGNPERGERARNLIPGATVVSSLESLLSDGPAFDLGVVATPPATHVRLASLLLRHGASVVLEKPAATTAADVEELVARAEAAGLALCGFMNRRYDGDVLSLAAALQSGVLGEPVHLTSTWERPAPVVLAEPLQTCTPPRVDSGALMNTGSHLVDQALVLLGPVDRVVARRTGVGWQGGDNLSFVHLEHASGAQSTVQISGVAHREHRELLLVGTRATLVCSSVQAPAPGRAVDARLIEASGHSAPHQSAPTSWECFYPQLAAALVAGEQLPVPHNELIALHRVLDACLAAARSGSAVTV